VLFGRRPSATTIFIPPPQQLNSFIFTLLHVFPPRRGDILFTMATMTMTPTNTKRNAKKMAKQVPENERFMRACSDIANALIQEYESSRDSSQPKKDVNLNKLRGTIAKKHSLSTQPPLTAIIAAVPEHYKKYILPKLIAKPIRTSQLSGGVLGSS
jgi:hypothetical protein